MQTASASEAGVRRAGVVRMTAEVRRGLIVGEALSFISRHGFENLRTRDIADRAGINSATLHHHFPTKQDLVAAVATRIADAFSAEKDASGEVRFATAASELRGQFADARFYRDQRPELLSGYREFVNRASRDEGVRDLVDRLNAGWRADIRRIVDRGVADGSFRADLDPAATTQIVLTAIWGALSVAHSGAASLELLCEEMIKLLSPDPPTTRAAGTPRR